MLANAAEALTGFNAAIVRSSSTTVGESYSLPAFGSGSRRGERILANCIGCLSYLPKITKAPMKIGAFLLYAEHVRQLGGESPLANLVAVKG